jgi:hypothetical protein
MSNLSDLRWLDAILVVHKGNCASLDIDDAYGATCWCLVIHKHPFGKFTICEAGGPLRSAENLKNFGPLIEGDGYIAREQGLLLWVESTTDDTGAHVAGPETILRAARVWIDQIITGSGKSRDIASQEEER